VETGIYVIDRTRLTCAGGTAGLDLAIELIERDHGHDLAVQVSEWFIRTEPRPAAGAQRMSLRERYGIRSDPLLKALARMEATIEDPEDRTSLAKRAGVSLRQLERLFATYLGKSIRSAYLDIRLDYAEMLLRKTAMQVTEVGVACGFNSTSHFSRAFRNRFGYPPSQI
jgi:transcriptional regulator GlxA family with amidase domain